MTLAQLVLGYRQRWSTILLGVLVGALVAVGYVLLTPTSYEATSRLFVTTTARTADGQLAGDAATATQQVRSFARLATSEQVLTAVIDELGLPMLPADLATRIRASADPGTVFIDLSVRDASATRARDITNAVGLQLPTAIAELDRLTPGIELRVTTPAAVPASPVAPRPLLGALLGLVGGGLLGLAGATAQTLLDRRLRTRTDVVRAAAVPVLTEVPLVAAHRIIADDQQAGTGYDEAFRRLRSHLHHAPSGRGPGSVVVTGTVPGEGRTSSAAGLALALVHSGVDTVLIDADLRTPAIAPVFGMDPSPGLTSLLTGSAPISDVMRRPRPGVGPRVITSGPAVANPGDLLGSPRMAALVRALTGHGLTVVIDAPPLRDVADAMALARQTDGVLLVVRSGVTRRDHLVETIEELRSIDVRVLGVTLNATPGTGQRAAPTKAAHAQAGRRRSFGSRRPAPTVVQVPVGGSSPGLDGFDTAGEPASRVAPPDTLAAAVESMLGGSPDGAPEAPDESLWPVGIPDTIAAHEVPEYEDVPEQVVQQAAEQAAEHAVEQAPEQVAEHAVEQDAPVDPAAAESLSALQASAPPEDLPPLSSDEIPSGEQVRWFELSEVGSPLPAQAPQPSPEAETTVDEPALGEPLRYTVEGAGSTWEVAESEYHEPDPSETQHSQPEYRHTQYSQTEYSQTEYPQTEYYQPEYREQEYSQAEHSQAEYSQTEYPRAEYLQPEYHQPEYREPEYSSLEYPQPQYPQPDVPQPDFPQPDSPEPHEHEPEYAEGSWAHPAPVEEPRRYDDTMPGGLSAPEETPSPSATPSAGYAYRYQPEVPPPQRAVWDLPRQSPTPTTSGASTRPPIDWGSPWNEAPRPDSPAYGAHRHDPLTDPLPDDRDTGEYGRHQIGRDELGVDEAPSDPVPPAPPMSLDSTRAQQITPGRRRR